MKTTADFLDDLRARHALASDSKLALHMGWQRAQLGRYRAKRETFSDQTALKVAAQLGIEPAYVMACMAWQRAKTPETRSAWERIAAKVAAVLVLGFAPGLFDSTQLSGAMGAESGPSTHMRQRRRQWPAVAWIRGALGRSALRLPLALVLALAAPAALADPWTLGDTGREAAYQTLLLADCLQTRYGIEHPEQFAESGPLARVTGGTEPSKGQLNFACLAVGIGHYAIARWLDRGAREFFQYTTIGIELYVVANNQWMAGARITF